MADAMFSPENLTRELKGVVSLLESSPVESSPSMELRARLSELVSTIVPIVGIGSVLTATQHEIDQAIRLHGLRPVVWSPATTLAMTELAVAIDEASSACASAELLVRNDRDTARTRVPAEHTVSKKVVDR